MNRKIKDFENYAICDDGRVFNCKTNRLLKPGTTNGYLYCVLRKDNKSHSKAIHRLVAEAFVPGYFEGAEVNHIDSDKTNNHYSNLEWLSREDNMDHWLKREQRRKAVEMIDKDTSEVLRVFESLSEAARFIGCNTSKIQRACKSEQYTSFGYKWKIKD